MKRGKKLLIIVTIVIAILIIAFLSGPKPSTPVYSAAMPKVPADFTGLINYVKTNEAKHKLKPDNNARIIWQSDSAKQKTDYVIVYIHGFSASQEEGDSVHRNIAKEFGCNLYLARIAEHGIDTTAQMINLTADKYWDSAKEALAIGKQLGKKVILMSTSTGGTVSLKLAATYPNDIAALILMSPNIAINNDKAWLLDTHWGLQLARLITGSDYVNYKTNNKLKNQYWYQRYRLEAAVQLQNLVSTSMNKETFEKVKQPTELLYYYKDTVHQDSTVKVSAELSMFNELGTPNNLKYKQAIPNAGAHPIGSYISSNDTKTVQKAIESFMTNTLGMKTR
ncbi:MAG: alpha/beta hydrolase [Mucilaginibacter sp.]|nr:alpha/beta hydrolase [Mucilaginibacter sp.]